MAPMPRLQVPPPPATPNQFGLLSVATQPDASDPLWMGAGIEWESRCAPDPFRGGVTLGPCTPEDVEAGDPTPPGPDKLDVDRGVDEGTAPAFTVWAAHRCSTTGRSLARDLERAGQLLTDGEGYMIDAAVYDGAGVPELEAESILGTAQVGGDVVATTPEGLVAALEWVASLYYRTGAVMHLRRDIATLAAGEGVVIRTGSRLETVLGTPVVASPAFSGAKPTGLDNDNVGSEEFVWGYVTGPLVAYRSDVVLPDRTEGGTLDRTVNNRLVVAERTVSVGWDCFAAGIAMDATNLYTELPDPPEEP